MTKIDKVELHEFHFEATNLGLSANTNSIGGLSFEKGAKTPITKYAVEILKLDLDLICKCFTLWTKQLHQSFT